MSSEEMLRNANAFLAYTHTTMDIEKATINDRPYFNGAGVSNEYKLTFRRGEQTISVIVLIDNMKERPGPVQMLSTLGMECSELDDDVSTFEEWCRDVMRTNPETSGDRYAVLEYQRDRKNEDYVLKRYAYLKSLKDTLQPFFGDHYILLTEFLVRCLLNHFPWSEERK